MESIKQLIFDFKYDEALNRLNQYLIEHTDDDEAYYLRGKIYFAKGEMRPAANNFQKAMELNQESPAHVAYQRLMHILDCSYNDQYNV